MKHRRSPTNSYPHNTALALHPSIPTLLSPLGSIANAPLPGDRDALDDFQSNAWIDVPSYRRTLAGLGITYLRGVSHGLEHSPLQTPADRPEGPLSSPAGTRETRISRDDLPPYVGLGLGENRHMAQCTPNFGPLLCGEPGGHPELGLDNDIDPTASDMIGLIPDVNMYDKLRRLDRPHPGVNPLDTIRGTSLHNVGISFGEPAPLTSEDHHDDVPLTMDSKAEQTPSPQVIQDIMSILIRPAPEFPLLPWSSANSPSAQSISPSQLAAPRSSVPLKFESTDVLDDERHALPAPCDLEYPTTHSSPILNAHLGIELNELLFRAERFRAKYPQRDIDRAWLSHFAGKLSERGELLDDFRCYVIGCDQRNKRRDHILVHVGAHIGQRPFACSVCSLRFLRKNECKRHEASHSGFRPYACGVCGQSFVRQDLVKRHVKRTHGSRDENETFVAKQPRKRARLH